MRNVLSFFSVFLITSFVTVLVTWKNAFVRPSLNAVDQTEALVLPLSEFPYERGSHRLSSAIDHAVSPGSSGYQPLRGTMKMASPRTVLPSREPSLTQPNPNALNVRVISLHSLGHTSIAVQVRVKPLDTSELAYYDVRSEKGTALITINQKVPESLWDEILLGHEAVELWCRYRGLDEMSAHRLASAFFVVDSRYSADDGLPRSYEWMLEHLTPDQLADLVNEYESPTGRNRIHDEIRQLYTERPDYFFDYFAEQGIEGINDFLKRVKVKEHLFYAVAKSRWSADVVKEYVHQKHQAEKAQAATPQLLRAHLRDLLLRKTLPSDLWSLSYWNSAILDAGGDPTVVEREKAILMGLPNPSSMSAWEWKKRAAKLLEALDVLHRYFPTTTIDEEPAFAIRVIDAELTLLKIERHWPPTLMRRYYGGSYWHSVFSRYPFTAFPKTLTQLYDRITAAARRACDNRFSIDAYAQAVREELGPALVIRWSHAEGRTIFRADPDQKATSVVVRARTYSELVLGLRERFNEWPEAKAQLFSGEGPRFKLGAKELFPEMPLRQGNELSVIFPVSRPDKSASAA